MDAQMTSLSADCGLVQRTANPLHMKNCLHQYDGDLTSFRQCSCTANVLVSFCSVLLWKVCLTLKWLAAALLIWNRNPVLVCMSHDDWL